MGCTTTQFSSDTYYPELAQTSLHSLEAQSHKSILQMPATSGVPRCPQFCLADYQFGCSHDLLTTFDNSMTHRTQESTLLMITCLLQVMDTTQEQQNGIYA